MRNRCPVLFPQKMLFGPHPEMPLMDLSRRLRFLEQHQSPSPVFQHGFLSGIAGIPFRLEQALANAFFHGRFPGADFFRVEHFCTPEETADFAGQAAASS